MTTSSLPLALEAAIQYNIVIKQSESIFAVAISIALLVSSTEYSL